ncbi:hypothetical protein G7Z17_g4619 [Cylindrodendrum hubeiense]|uniref:Uncharacterized protein n=1 Tax=Cylindrodendrum hubeiense TaxID=595255 RepID=A0A9P5HFR1_9HYPO|nr:hypothetical protein G7Z17_g4619 [Cylindrodendrum hubeiense]
MFIYTGQLQWQRYAVDELFVVVLPNGPVRVGDTVYLYSQWTVDSKGFKKPKWFQHQTVEKLTRDDNGDDTFSLSHGYYSWEIQSQQSYQKISITMSKASGYQSIMSLERTYQPKGEVSTDSARIWTGSLDWPQYATNEPFITIVPEGFGAGKPVLAFWQWTVNADGKPNFPCILKGVQQADTPSEASLKFTFADYYTMTCTWDEKTENLAIHMQEPQKHGQDIGPFDLAALVEFHSDDINPPGFPGENAELKVYYPRVEPALSRIQTPMPFPPTLVETLTHTASFVDQAGYLAKYAVDRYHTLDKSYHALIKQIDDLNSQIRELTGKVNGLAVDSDNEKKEINSLQKKLAQSLDVASNKEAELTQQVQDLQKTLAQDKTHDVEDHKALDVAHEQIQKEQEARAKLEKQVVMLQFALSDSGRRIMQLQANASELVQEISDLRGQLDVEKAHNADLKTQTSDLKAKVAVLESDAVTMKKTLADTTEGLEQARVDADDKDKIIEGLEDGMVAIKKDRDAKNKAFKDLQKSTSTTIQELEDQIAKLKGGSWQLPDESFFPHGQTFPSELQQVIDESMDMLKSALGKNS